MNHKEYLKKKQDVVAQYMRGVAEECLCDTKGNAEKETLKELMSLGEKTAWDVGFFVGAMEFHTNEEYKKAFLEYIALDDEIKKL
jgi:hypothetical protein